MADLTPKLRGLRSPFWLAHRSPPPRSACPARRTSPPRYSCRGHPSPHTPRHSPRAAPSLAPSLPLAEAASLRIPRATHPRAAPSPTRRTSPPRHPCRGRPFPHAPRRHRARQRQEALPAPLATPVLQLFFVLRSEDRACGPDGGENITKTKIKKRVIFLRPLTTAFGRKINALF